MTVIGGTMLPLVGSAFFDDLISYATHTEFQIQV